MNRSQKFERQFIPLAYGSSSRYVLARPGVIFSRFLHDHASPLCPAATAITTEEFPVLALYLDDDIFPSKIGESLSNSMTRLVSSSVIQKDYGEVRIEANLATGKIHCVYFDGDARTSYPAHLTRRDKELFKKAVLADSTENPVLREIVGAHPKFFESVQKAGSIQK